MRRVLPLFFTLPAAAAVALGLMPSPGPARGQSSPAPPQIELLPPVAPVMPAAPAPPVPEAGGGGEIRLPITEPAAATPLQPLAKPLTRNRGEAVGTAMSDLILSLAPARPLPQGAEIGASLTGPGIMRLTGELASVDMVLHMPEILVMPEHLRLTLRSSVNILPQTSELSLSVNDGPPVAQPLTELGPFATAILPAPGLMAGVNRIRLQLRQPHRIYCGPDATFAVWTEIDLAASGVTVPSETLVTERDGFMAGLQNQQASGLPLAIMAADNTDAAIIREVAILLADLAGGPVPVVVRSFYDMAPPGPVSVALIAADRPHFAFRRSARDTVVLQLEHAAGGLPDLSAMAEAAPPAPAQQAPEAADLHPGETTTFASLGIGDFAGNTHYFLRDIPFNLPDDWLLLANQRARMDLHYGFADGLPPGALVLVKVNGQTVRLLPLDKDGGRLRPRLDIGFPANILHAGQNAVTFEMIVPGTPPDEACPLRRADMLVVMGDSTLTVPPAPRMRMGGLAEPLRVLGGDAIAVPDGAQDLVGLSREVVSMSALLPARANPDGNGFPVRLSVVRAEDAALMPAGAFPGLTARRISEALAPRLSPALSPTGEVPAEAARFRLTEEEPAALPIGEGPGAASRLWNEIANSFSSGGWIARDLARLRDALFLVSDGALSDWLVTRTGRALLMQPDPAALSSLWLVLGPETPVAEVARAIGTLQRDGVAQGEAALLQDDGRWLIWSSGRPPQLLEPVRPGNVLAILGNYASWSPLLFTLSMLAVALLSCVPALLYILTTRPREGGR